VIESENAEESNSFPSDLVTFISDGFLDFSFVMFFFFELETILFPMTSLFTN